MATQAEKKAAAAAKVKSDKFVSLAQARTTKAINSIRSISKLSNRSNYVFTQEQVDKISEALRNEVVEMHEKFNTKTAAVKEGFVL